jgi:pimeloyl-ACP methyl ester carboxylesterase
VKLVPGAELELLPRLGHVPMADDPDRTAEVIEEFVARASRRSREPREAAPA